MPQVKNNQLSKELQGLYSYKKPSIGLLIDTFEFFKKRIVTKELQKHKSKGLDASELFYNLVISKYYDISNVWNITKKNFSNLTAGKDSFYRLKNNSNICWRTILYLFVKIFFLLVKDRCNNSQFGESVLIIDDTDLPKSGRKIENIGKVFSHVYRKSIIGFKGLVLGYWDKSSFIPLDFCLQNEKGQNKNKPQGMEKSKLKQRLKKKRDKKQPGYRRVTELNKSKILNALTMLRRAVKRGYKASYVLFDSWFTCKESISTIRALNKGKTHVLCIAKMNNWKYQFSDGKLYNLKEILRILKHKRQKAQGINASYIETVVHFGETQVKLFYSKFKGDRNWTIILTTNCDLGYEEAIKLYTMRWTIEVFFRESKQLFNFGKSCSSNFDGQIADLTISMIQYIVMSLHKRIHKYESMYGLFQEQSDLNKELVVAEKIWNIFVEILFNMAEELKISFEDIFKAFSNALTNHASFETRAILQDFKQNHITKCNNRINVQAG